MRLDQVPVTKAMAKYLTVICLLLILKTIWLFEQLGALVGRLRDLGVQYIVLAIDEMNMLHDTNFNGFRKTIMSLVNAMLRHFKNLFVVFAGNYYDRNDP